MLICEDAVSIMPKKSFYATTLIFARCLKEYNGLIRLRLCLFLVCTVFTYIFMFEQVGALVLPLLLLQPRFDPQCYANVLKY